MPLFLLDTDHVTLLQRGHKIVAARLSATDPAEVVVSIVTYEEQPRGRLAVVHQAKSAEDLCEAYLRLHEMHAFFCASRMLDFDRRVAEVYVKLRRTHCSHGTLDLRIAATALAAGATVVTRNTRDFSQIPALALADWTAQS